MTLRLSRRKTAGLLAVGLALGLAQPGWANPDTSASGKAAAPEADVHRGPAGTSVTLITGDRVTMTSKAGSALIEPAEGREDVRFFTRQTRDGLTVVPEDAQPLLRDGTLDERLFNLTLLREYGYQDATRTSLPVMVGYRNAGARKRVTTTLDDAGADVGRALPAIDGMAVTVPKARAEEVWASVTDRTAGAGSRLDADSGVQRIWLDGKRKLLLDESVPQIGAPAAYGAGITGKGVTVAVLDGGVDVEHPDLADQVAEARNFTDDPDPADNVGHGTHVASTIGGSGEASQGRLRGVAPDATLISGKVCETRSCDESAMLAAMQWAAAEKQADVISISIGGADRPGTDPLEEAVDTLTEETGSLFVIAAGNSGPGNRTVDSPGSADAALTVGAVDKSDQLAQFSGRGPRAGDDGVKPDITAPGVDIVAARASDTAMGAPVDEYYTQASGTSMATPHVSGAAALLAQQHPEWEAQELKTALMGSAEPHAKLTPFQQGTGRVDVARAITQTVRADQGSLSFGRTLWPHHDDEPVTKTVTYVNSGSDDITLDIAVEATGPEGATAPEGMFQAGAEQVTVPAGGQAEVTLTADTRVDAADGTWSGRLTATGGPAQLTTPFSLHREVESYSLTLTHLGEDGEATDAYDTYAFNMKTGAEHRAYDADGAVTLRLPKGTYGISNVTGTNAGLAMLALPETVLDRDRSLTVDARTAGPITMTTEIADKNAELFQTNIGQTFRTDTGRLLTTAVMADSFAGISVGPIDPEVSSNRFRSLVSGQWAERNADGDFNASPYLYAAGEEVEGRMPTGFTEHYRGRDFATVRQEFADTTNEQGTGYRYLDAMTGFSSAWPLRTTLPSERTEYVTGGVEWGSALMTVGDQGFLSESSLENSKRSYKAGRTYSEQWDSAPFGPSLAHSRNFAGVVRSGNSLRARIGLFGDAKGHPGTSSVDSARTALYRDGELLDEYDYTGGGDFTLPADPGEYRLTASAKRSFTGLSTEVDAAWTFASERADGPARLLPLLSVGFTPELDAASSAPAGQRFTIPVKVAHQPGSTGGGRITRPTVEASYDDGKTWETAKVTGGKGKNGWKATVDHPGGAGYVSLRATATDTAGNAVTQTIVRAYRLS